MNRDRESRPRLVSDGSFFGDSSLAFQHDRDSRDRDRDNIRIFLKCLELLVSVETVRHVASRC